MMLLNWRMKYLLYSPMMKHYVMYFIVPVLFELA